MTDDFRIIDLSQIQPPDVVETLDYEAILAGMLADLRMRAPSFDALVESDPAYKILEVCAYRELLLRQRVNDASCAVMLAFATGSDLDHLAALYNVGRLVVTPAYIDDSGKYIPAVMESDERLRARVLLAPYGWSCAGSVKAYEYFALSADAAVKSAGISSPVPGTVQVAVLSTAADGVPSPALLAKVEAALSAETVRPLCDTVVVAPARVVYYSVEAAVWLGRGPDPSVVLDDAEAAVKVYAASVHTLGCRAAVSGIYAALHRPGVRTVSLASPLHDVECEHDEAPFCEAITLTLGDSDD
jgi:phage-related baseplate assembly protein